MLKSSINAFKIKQVQTRNRLKIDDYKPTIMLVSNNEPARPINTRSHTRKRQLSLPNKHSPQIKQMNQIKHQKNLGQLKLKLNGTQKKQNRQNQNEIEAYNNSQSSNNVNRGRNNSVGIKIKLIPVEQPNPLNSETLPNDIEQLNDSIEEIINVMSKKYMLSINSGVIKIKRQKLSFILMFLVRTMLNLSDNQSSFCHHFPPEIISVFDNITALKQSIIHKKKLNKLEIHSGIANKMILINDIDKQTESYTKKICDLIEHEKNMQQRILSLKHEIQQRSQYCNTIKVEVLKIEENIYNAKQEHTALLTKNEQLITNINELQKNFDELQQKGNSVFLFIQNQKKKPFLNKVSQDYKQTESQMFDFASEMISRPQMHSYVWEPEPFEAVQKLIQSDMKRTLERIQYDNIPLETKTKEMKQLIVKSMKHVNIKHEAMRSIFKQKTEAINNFINIMDKWRSQHKMKNHYLGTMRQEYAVDSAVVEQCITDMQKADTVTANMKKTIAKLRKHWDWTHSAFLYGNSFY